MRPWLEWAVIATTFEVMALAGLILWELLQGRHILLFYEMMFEERARQLEEQAEALRAIEQRIKDVEAAQFGP